MRAALRGLALGSLTLAGAALLGLSNTMTADAHLMASTLIMKGTDIGFSPTPTDAVYTDFADNYIQRSYGTHPASQVVDYPAGFFPVSKGTFSDPTYGASVRQGLANLKAKVAENPGGDNVFFGYSQSAVIGSKYKQEVVDAGGDETPDVTTFVFVANPMRPNGGILMRFKGLYVPLLDINFEGATPTEGYGPDGITTYDIAQQYDGWADFPAYPLNLLATANAIAGIYYLHGTEKYDALDDPDADILNDPTKTDKSVSGDTTYYLIKTNRLPILRPFEGIVPEPILAAADPVLRVVVEAAYDRSDYGKPTAAGLIPPIDPSLPADLAAAAQRGVQVATQSTPQTTAATVERSPEPETVQPATDFTTATTPADKPDSTPPTGAPKKPADLDTPPVDLRQPKPKVRNPITATPFDRFVKSLQRPFSGLQPTTAPEVVAPSTAPTPGATTPPADGVKTSPGTGSPADGTPATDKGSDKPAA